MFTNSNTLMLLATNKQGPSHLVRQILGSQTKAAAAVHLSATAAATARSTKRPAALWVLQPALAAVCAPNKYSLSSAFATGRRHASVTTPQGSQPPSWQDVCEQSNRLLRLRALSVTHRLGCGLSNMASTAGSVSCASTVSASTPSQADT